MSDAARQTATDDALPRPRRTPVPLRRGAAVHEAQVALTTLAWCPARGQVIGHGTVCTRDHTDVPLLVGADLVQDAMSGGPTGQLQDGS